MTELGRTWEDLRKILYFKRQS